MLSANSVNDFLSVSRPQKLQSHSDCEDQDQDKWYDAIDNIELLNSRWELFLNHNKKFFSVTEISAGEYYSMRGGNRMFSLQKEADSEGFKLIDEEFNIKTIDGSWCVSRNIGRRLLMDTEAVCTTEPIFNDEVLTYRTNVLFRDGNDAYDFDVRYRGLYGMDTATRLDVKRRLDNTLFYENGELDLKQEDIDASAYERVFADRDIEIIENDLTFSDSSFTDFLSPVLTKNEKIAIRRWTAIDGSDRVFSDGMQDAELMAIAPINYELNNKLANSEFLSEEERNMVKFFDSGLNKIPAQKGDFIRVSEYTGFNTPWDNEIKPGDIVTNFPCYMSVSAGTSYINSYAILDGEIGVYLRFENTYSSKPLLYGTASLIKHEFESVFRRNSAFKVKQIAIADEDISSVSVFGKRIVVILEEVDLPPSGIAKNIHTGMNVNVVF